MKTTGRHLLVEYRGCDPGRLSDKAHVEQLMRRAAVAAGATVVASVFQTFSPQGITGVVVIEESHLSIHTWPEHRYAAVDFYTCGDCTPEAAHQVLVTGLAAARFEALHVARGAEPPRPSIRVVEHTRRSVDERSAQAAGSVA